MTTTSHDDLPALWSAARARLGLVVALVAVAALGWVWTARQMQGMDAGPWTALGSLREFLGVWVVMMAAMMVPSVAPTAALYARVTSSRSRWLGWWFVAGYLLVWAAAGVAAFALGAAATHLLGAGLGWVGSGRLLSGATLLGAAAYELTPLKDVCLGHCRSPLAALLGSWYEGPAGAVQAGVRNGAWCAGCCWALMAALFALGVMSVLWMALVAALATAQKVLPWRRATTVAAAAVLFGLGLLVLVAPEALPVLTVPSSGPMG
jgi:predicted metal-binding membrane protein